MLEGKFQGLELGVNVAEDVGELFLLKLSEFPFDVLTVCPSKLVGVVIGSQLITVPLMFDVHPTANPVHVIPTAPHNSPAIVHRTHFFIKK